GSPADRFECASCPSLSVCVLSALKVDSRRAVRGVHRIRFTPGETIFRQGAPALGWYILCRGRAKLVVNTARRKRFILWFCKPGDILNLMILGPHAFSVVAIDHCVVGFIEREGVRFLLREHPELEAEAHRRLAEQEDRLVQRVADLVGRSVRERLVQVLLGLGEEHGIDETEGIRIDLPLSQQDLADLVGTSRQKVNLNLRKLANQGLIRAERGRIIILDEEGQQRLG
ncbi:MAG: Crp/Fnr family transcriptional regulator, partial [Anaerolineae bacterium]|nr:Crp/Fnr family transcriptional regulator [Anaerolineae bacterium]